MRRGRLSKNEEDEIITSGGGIKLTKTQALMLLATGFEGRHNIMCKEYGDDEDWVGMTIEDIETLLQGDEYKTFEIW